MSFKFDRPILCILVVGFLLCVSILSIYLLKGKNENYRIQTPNQKWINIWMNESYKLCNPRVKADCSSNKTLSCIKQSMRECQFANQSLINKTCLNFIQEKQCNTLPKEEQNKCKTLLSIQASQGTLCTIPDLPF